MAPSDWLKTQSYDRISNNSRLCFLLQKICYACAHPSDLESDKSETDA